MISTPSDQLTVDVHAHTTVAAVDDLVRGQPGFVQHLETNRRRTGDVSWTESRAMLAERSPLLVDLDRRIAHMDATGVDVQVVSVAAQFHYWAERQLSTEICLAVNQAVAQLCAQAPKRLRGLGTIPLQHPDLCAPMLRDALGRGLKGVIVGSHAEAATGTIELSDHRLEPFWALAEGSGAIILLHPLGCPLGERLDRWYLSNIVGQPLEHAVALSHLIFSGVLDRWPRLYLVAAHGGGYLPPYTGRADHAWRTRRDSRSCQRPPSTYLPDLYFDTCVHDSLALQNLLRRGLADRLLMGSDYPYDMGIADPLAFLASAEIAQATANLIAVANPRKLGLHASMEGQRLD